MNDRVEQIEDRHNSFTNEDQLSQSIWSSMQLTTRMEANVTSGTPTGDSVEFSSLWGKPSGSSNAESRTGGSDILVAKADDPQGSSETNTLKYPFPKSRSNVTDKRNWQEIKSITDTDFLAKSPYTNDKLVDSSLDLSKAKSEHEAMIEAYKRKDDAAVQQHMLKEFEELQKFPPQKIGYLMGSLLQQAGDFALKQNDPLLAKQLYCLSAWNKHIYLDAQAQKPGVKVQDWTQAMQFNSDLLNCALKGVDEYMRTPKTQTTPNINQSSIEQMKKRVELERQRTQRQLEQPWIN